MVSDVAYQQYKQKVASLEKMASGLLLESLQDKDTIEVSLNPDGKLWVEKAGQDMVCVGEIAEAQARGILNLLAGIHSKVVDFTHPQLDAEWVLDGSRFSGGVPPIAARPFFSIRKHSAKLITLSEYVASGIMTEKQRDAIRQAVSEKANILIGGSTGSGKTTLGNGVLREIECQFPNRRMAIIEDISELQCSLPNTLYLHTSANVGHSELVKQCLRLRPDSILLGEVRDQAALDLMEAWNTGHPGGFATIHADSAVECLQRLETLIEKHPYRPQHIEQVIGYAVQLIVFIQRTPAGRKISEILRLDGYDKKAGDYRFEKL